MKNVWDICEFSNEIKTGDLGISKFAVELHSILDNTADKNYMDPKIFLDNTYVTDAIEIILKDSLLRLVKNQGKAVDLLDVSFGGGKTHSIVLLYHIFRNKSYGTKFIKENKISSKYGIEQIPDVDVIAIDCRQIKKQTLWGEIADRLNKFDDFKKNDEEKIPPNDISQIKSLFTKPTLLMLDELPHYLMKTKLEGTQFTDANFLFLNELVSAVNSTQYTRLIITTTAEQKLLQDTSDKVKKITAFDAYDVANNLKESVSRGADPLVPVKEKDAYGVIRKRLVKYIDEVERDKVIDSYYKYYYENGLVIDQDYKEKMLNAYPFHPFFIETLYKRVGTIQDFNKTRGMFRLMGLVLHYIVKNKTPCTLISTGELQLAEQPIMDDLTSKVHKDFQELIQSDCIDKSQKLDKNKNIKIVEKMARTIYLYSLIGTAGNMSGIRLPELQLAISVPGMDMELIKKSLYEDIENEFWFIKNKHGEFYFDKDPNINKIIEQYKRDVSKEKMRDIIFEQLKSLMIPQSGIKPIIWSENKLDENDIIRIFVVDYEEYLDNITAENKMSQILTEKPGGEIRSNQNTIVMLYADKNVIDSLKDKAKLVAGIKAAENDERIKLDRENMKTLKSRLDTSKGELETACIQTYSNIAYPKNTDIRLDQIFIMETKHTTLTEMVVECLQKKGKLLDPTVNLSHDIIKFKDTINITKILNRFKIDKSKHFILENQQIFNAVKDGIQNGEFGYAETLDKKDGKYLATINENITPSWEGFLIQKELVYVSTKMSKIKQEIEREKLELQNNFKYQIATHNIQKNMEILDQLSILDINITLQKRFETTIIFGGTTISIITNLEKQSDIQSLLKLLKSKEYDGKGIFTIRSNIDLQNDFKKWKTEFKII